MGRPKKRAIDQMPVSGLNDVLRFIREQEGYPSERERTAILQRREKLMQDLVYAMMVAGDEDQQEMRTRQVLQKYASEDTLAVMGNFEKAFRRPSFIADDAWVYRRYRQAFALYGGKRRFLHFTEFNDLTIEQASLEARRHKLFYRLPPSK